MGFVKSAYIKEISGGNKMFKKLKDKKGFTLVELIVVLVILAILAALLIPALTGYIDKANGEKIIAETRMIVMATQTETTTTYAKGKIDDTDNPVSVDNVKKLAEVSALNATTNAATFSAEVTADGKVLSVLYVNGSLVCFYDGTGYHAGLLSENTTVTTPSNTITVATAATTNPVTKEL